MPRDRRIRQRRRCEPAGLRDELDQYDRGNDRNAGKMTVEEPVADRRSPQSRCRSAWIDGQQACRSDAWVAGVAIARPAPRAHRAQANQASRDHATSAIRHPGSGSEIEMPDTMSPLVDRFAQLATAEPARPLIIHAAEHRIVCAGRPAARGCSAAQPRSTPLRCRRGADRVGCRQPTGIRGTAARVPLVEAAAHAGRSGHERERGAGPCQRRGVPPRSSAVLGADAAPREIRCPAAWRGGGSQANPIATRL